MAGECAADKETIMTTLLSAPERVGDGSSDDRGALGVFMVLVFAAIALVVVSIVLLIGMSIAGGFDGATGVDAEEFDFAESGEQTYQVENNPTLDDIAAVADTVAVRENGEELDRGDEYTWDTDTGEVTILAADDTATYEIDYSYFDGSYAEERASTVQSTGDSFELFGTSVLVIPAAATLAVLIGGLVGAISMRNGMPGMNGNGNGGPPRRR